MSVMASVPGCVPFEVGVKATLTAQLLPAANVLPQVLLVTVYGPVTCTLEMVADTLPVLLTVTVLGALVLPAFTLPKFRLVGDTLSVGGAVPVPVSGIVCGLPGPLSVTESVALLIPEAIGLKVTLMVQLAPTARLVPQPLARAKSPLLVPVMATLLIVSAEPVPLVSVSV